MAEKFIYNNGGIQTEKEAITTSSGAGDAGKIIATDGSGKIDQTLMPTGVGPDAQTFIAGENLSAGNVVNIYNDAGTIKARKADAANGYSADGFVTSSYSSGATATVYFSGTISGLSALTGGARYYLSATPGILTTTAPTTSGYILQFIGKALSTTSVTWEPSDYLVLA